MKLNVHKFNFKFNDNFMKRYVILLISAIIPVFILVSIIYQETTSVVQKQSREAALNMLDKTCQSVDLVLKQIKEKMIQVVDNSEITNHVLNINTKNKFENNIELLNSIRKAVSNSEFIKSIYIYTETNGTVMTSDGGIYSISDFYDKDWLGQYYNLFHGMTSYRGIYQLDTRKAKDMWGVQNNYVTLICGLPYGLERKMGGVILNISQEKLYSMISSHDINGDLFVINSEGYIIAHSKNELLYSNLKYLDNYNCFSMYDQSYFTEKANGKWELYTFVTSPDNGWKYIYKIPLSVLYGSENYITKIIIIVMLSYFALSLIIFFFVSRKMYNPISKLLKIVSGNSTGPNLKHSSTKNDCEFLGMMYSNVLDHNKDMELMIESMKPLLKEKMLSSILLNDEVNLKEITERLKLLKINMDLPNFIAFIMQLNSFEGLDEMDRSICSMKLVNLTESLIPDGYKGLCCEIEPNKFVTILNFPENEGLIQDQGKVIEVIKKIKSSIENEMQFTLIVGIGRICSSIEKTRTSYHEAQRALRYKLYQGKDGNINTENKRYEPEELYSYLSEKQPLIVNNLKIGNYTEIEKIINDMFMEITKDNKLSYEYIQIVLTKIINSIIELIVNYGKTVKEIFLYDRDLYKEIMEKENIEEIRIWILDICRQVASSIDELHLNHTSKNIEKVLEYIDENLHKEMSLRDVADYVGLSSGYISSIFKEHLGKNYIDYLNGKRIERAKHLLKESQINVKEVGFRVGFNNIQTFLRTFKKYEGVTPGQFRDRV